MPNVYISKGLAVIIEKKSDYSKNKGLDEKKYVSLIEDALKDHGQLSRIEITDILWDVLPSILDDEQKKNMVYNLLKKLKKQGILDNTGKSPKSQWYLVK